MILSGYNTDRILSVAEDLAHCLVNSHIHHIGLVTPQNRNGLRGHIAVPHSHSRVHSSSYQEAVRRAEVKTFDSLQENKS